MNLYPLDLVLALALASASIFLGYVPARILRAGFFPRQVFVLAAGWIVVAALSPVEIIHYPLLLAGLCLLAAWRLRDDEGLSGKLWLAAASALGFTLVPVLILAVTPGAWPADRSPRAQFLFLVSLALGGAIPGLAGALYLLTRREATEMGMVLRRLPGLLVLLAAIWCGLILAGNPPPWSREAGFHPGRIISVIGAVTVLMLAVIAGRRSRSSRPSTAGPSLMMAAFLGLLLELVTLSHHDGIMIYTARMSPAVTTSTSPASVRSSSAPDSSSPRA